MNRTKKILAGINKVDNIKITDEDGKARQVKKVIAYDDNKTKSTLWELYDKCNVIFEFRKPDGTTGRFSTDLIPDIITDMTTTIQGTTYPKYVSSINNIDTIISKLENAFDSEGMILDCIINQNKPNTLWGNLASIKNFNLENDTNVITIIYKYKQYQLTFVNFYNIQHMVKTVDHGTTFADAIKDVPSVQYKDYINYYETLGWSRTQNDDATEKNDYIITSNLTLYPVKSNMGKITYRLYGHYYNPKNDVDEYESVEISLNDNILTIVAEDFSKPENFEYYAGYGYYCTYTDTYYYNSITNTHLEVGADNILNPSLIENTVHNFVEKQDETTYNIHIYNKHTISQVYQQIYIEDQIAEENFTYTIPKYAKLKEHESIASIIQSVENGDYETNSDEAIHYTSYNCVDEENIDVINLETVVTRDISIFIVGVPRVYTIDFYASFTRPSGVSFSSSRIRIGTKQVEYKQRFKLDREIYYNNFEEDTYTHRMYYYQFYGQVSSTQNRSLTHNAYYYCIGDEEITYFYNADYLTHSRYVNNFSGYYLFDSLCSEGCAEDVTNYTTTTIATTILQMLYPVQSTNSNGSVHRPSVVSVEIEFVGLDYLFVLDNYPYTDLVEILIGNEHYYDSSVYYELLNGEEFDLATTTMDYVSYIAINIYKIEYYMPQHYIYHMSPKSTVITRTDTVNTNIYSSSLTSPTVYPSALPSKAEFKYYTADYYSLTPTNFYREDIQITRDYTLIPYLTYTFNSTYAPETSLDTKGIYFFKQGMSAWGHKVWALFVKDTINYELSEETNGIFYSILRGGENCIVGIYCTVPGIRIQFYNYVYQNGTYYTADKKCRFITYPGDLSGYHEVEVLNSAFAVGESTFNISFKIYELDRVVRDSGVYSSRVTKHS